MIMELTEEGEDGEPDGHVIVAIDLATPEYEDEDEAED
jgi:hypothetical protein